MHARRPIRAVAAALALGVLLLLGATTGSAFAHEVQHAGHHSAGMHHQGMCAWMCAAGQSLGAVACVFQVDAASFSPAGPPAAQDPLAAVLPAPVTRGPPVLRFADTDHPSARVTALAGATE